MGVLVFVLLVILLAAGALLYAGRAKREAERTGLELDKLQEQHEPPEETNSEGQTP
jgi:hypothetical protein